MDERLRTISMTFFSGELNTIDIMMLKSYLLGIEPSDTIFSINKKNNNFVMNFKYDSCLASDYINEIIEPIVPEDYPVYSPMIAKELTNYDIICDDIDTYISSSKKLKRVIKFYKTNSDKHNKRINEANKKLKIALSKGIDYDYIKGTCT
ncbi:SPV075 hypothetical protein [Swinepox virus]|uniref:Uncharacterized protein n=2 Tax=Swinepox virus TaxID=10276 RepID=Q8V3M0_SWPV1|nr:SPV075 hypothetical protein [Swinepox virus]AAL69814.1 SPV075 hypothetical protein [Swinepox virus]QQG31565.1 hypothetical protein [Swinepox virus]UED36650.1 SPV075 hypothetical protein [Swinepox virus]UED36799.1 SPV075 hypothetical protein [Swinepox virus]UUA44265.1 SPV075 [Swinepox virus]